MNKTYFQIPLILPYFVIHCYKQGPQPPLNDTEAQTQNLENEEEKPFINQDGDIMELQEIAIKNENVSRSSLNSTSAIIVQPTSTETATQTDIDIIIHNNENPNDVGEIMTPEEENIR